MAHIFAAKDAGPRANTDLAMADRAGYRNLILLCPHCHTEVDKAPDTFPNGMIRDWKDRHKERIRAALGAGEFATRQEARAYIERLLRANQTVFDMYGPDSSYRENPEAEQASVWQRKMLSQIILNNETVLFALDANSRLMRPNERKTKELLRQHVADLIERHFGRNLTICSRFPPAMAEMFCYDEAWKRT